MWGRRASGLITIVVMTVVKAAICGQRLRVGSPVTCNTFFRQPLFIQLAGFVMARLSPLRRNQKSKSVRQSEQSVLAEAPGPRHGLLFCLKPCNVFAVSGR